MPKGLKKDFPFYAKKEDIVVTGIVDLGRLTPKTFNSFLKMKHGPDTNMEDYIIFDLTNLNAKDVNVKEA